MNLENFKTNNLFEATTQLLKEQLNIKINLLPNKKLSVKDYFKDAMHKLFDQIESIYTVGIINEQTFLDETEIEDWKEKIDYQTIFVVAVELKNTQNRSNLANLTRLFNKPANKNDKGNPLIIVFRYNNKITISSLERQARNPKDWREGEKISDTKVAMLKDIEIENPHRAHLDILKELAKHNAKTFEELYKYWQEKLNTKELNNKFYQELFKWYLYAKDNVVFPNDNQEEADKYLSESLIRFISRMLFVWFMKEKSLISNQLFETNELKNILKNFDEKSDKNIYYKAILQNLFFATLNVPTENREWIASKRKNKEHQGNPLIYRFENEFINSEKIITEIFNKIPFLNGGLFDCLDDRHNNIFIDGFTNKNEKKQPQFPNYLFFGEHKNIDLSHHFADDAKEKKKWQNQTTWGIIDLLHNYKFTIEENTPLEIDVALDPELLGKVFENLLASFNPETKATARKQTGSFYTPREIVNYMVDESLKAYLSSNFQCTSSLQCTSSFQLEEKLGARSSKDKQSEVHWNTQGYFDPNNEIIIYKKKLPHWQQENVWYFVTFRLADSIPEEKKEEIKRERENWDKNHKTKKEYTKEDWIMYNKLFHENTEKLLNSGYGKCLMNKKEHADIVANALLHFNNERYILDEWVVMPNHVHVLVKPIGEHYLGDILHSWKSFTANEINKKEGLSGQLWMTESYDHIVRNRESFNAFRYYIRENPSKAKITVFRASNQEQTVLRASSSEQKFEQDARSTNKQDSVLRASSSKESQSTVLELFSITSHEQMSDTLRARSSKYVQALFNCKILDPACGSGAYPMGVLHKMVELMTILDPKNEHLKEREGKKLDDLIKSAKNLSDTNTRNQTIEALQKQKDILQKAEYDYVRKLYIIENCIYGVDIQPIAIQISKLRFFISLLVEQNKKEDQPNFGIEPLPNMDFKLVAANTLIAPPQEDKADQTGLFADQDPFFETFENLAHDYFTLHTPEEKKTKKKEIITLIKEKIEEKKRLIASSCDFAKLKDSVYLWESYQNLFKEKAVGFFETKYFFPKVKDGFDVVIGNPPYLKVQNIPKSQTDYFKKTFDSAKGKYDIYVIFIENSIKNLVKENGQVVFINPHRFMIAEYGFSLRNYLIKNKAISKILVFGVEQVFDTATTYTGIFFFSKNSKKIDFCEVNNFSLNNLIFESYEFSKMELVWSFKNNKNSTMLDKLTKHQLVKDIFKGIFQGLISMGDDIQMLEGKIIDDKFIGYSKRLQKIIEIESILMKPVLKGENIQRYSELKPNLYVFYPHVLNNKNKTIPIDEVDLKIKFPLGYEYILNFKEELENKKIKYKTNPKYWYSLHRSRELNLFNSKKIITPQLQNNSNFTIDKNSFFPDAGGYMLIKKENDLVDIDIYLAIFNSKLFYYFIKQTSTPYNNNYYYFKTNYIQPFSIPEIPETAQQPFITLVNEILEGKKTAQDTSHLEHQIDIMVYHLYGLSYEEACVIDKELKEEDYRTSSFQLEA